MTFLVITALLARSAIADDPCSTAVETRDCGAWCEEEGAPDWVPCKYPDQTQCRDEFCCQSCGSWRAYMKPTVPICSCSNFKTGACFASDCKPCSQKCFPHSSGGVPLGLGILCTASS